MKLVRNALAAFALGATVVLAACSDSSPTAPVSASAPNPAVQADLLGTLTQTLNNLFLRCSPLPTATASKSIGPLGGVIVVGPHSLRIPPGALTQQVTITATAPTGNVNRVTLAPHGLQFDRPAYLTMSYDNCAGLSSLLPKRIAYVDSNWNILEFLRSLDNIWTNDVTGRLDHFSDYILAW